MTLAGLSAGFYLASLALLPWAWFPPFPWLHRHAQWSDLLFAAAAACWAAGRIRSREPFRLRPFHLAAAGYLGAAGLSLLLAGRGGGIPKLLGMAELAVLAVITSDLASRPAMARAMARTVAYTSLLAALAALAGLVLFYAGVQTPLVGTYGDLEPSRWYARAQAGLYHPNLLASYCIFAAAVLARDPSGVPGRWGKLCAAALWLTVLLTFSRAILGFAMAALLRTRWSAARPAATRVLAAGCVVLLAFLTVGNLSLDPARPWEARFLPGVPSSRSESFTSSLRTLAAHPWTGTGPGSAPGLRQGMPFDAHCTPLNIAATLGLPALAAFAGIFVFLWRDRARPADLAVWSGLAGIGLDALASDVEDFRHVWVLIGMAGAGGGQDRNAPSS